MPLVQPSNAFRGADRALGLLVLALAYVCLAKLGLALASLHPSASPVWPPSGLALAAVLLWGNRVWPAIGAGAFLTNVTTFGSISSSLGIALGNTIEALLTAWLLGRWSGGPATFETPSRVARFAIITIAPGTMVSATIGVFSLVLTGHAEASRFSDLWMTWWLGDVGGQLLVAPVIVLWARSIHLPPTWSEVKDLSSLLAGTLLVGLVAFSPLVEQASIRGPLAFLTIAPLLWAALRYRQRDAATVALVLSALAIGGTLANGGPFARANLNDSFLLVLAFVISTAVPSLVLSADVAVRKRAEETQRLLIGELSHRVKNTLATVQAIATQTLRGASPADFTASFSARLQALSRAHNLMTLTGWKGADLHALVQEQVMLGSKDGRVTASGPYVLLEPQTALAFAMVLHELGTNARKHGALAAVDGRLSLTWSLQGDSQRFLSLRWAETGSARPAAATGRGFGIGLIEDSLRAAGEARMQRISDGIVWDIRLALPPRSLETYDPIPSLVVANGVHALGQSRERAVATTNITGKRILVVEDEPLVAMDLHAILREAGIDVVGPAARVDQALGLLADGPLDGALLDANLGGERVDEVAAALARKRVPFAFVTGYGRESLPQAFGSVPMISKPFVARDLLQAVSRLVSAAGSS